MPSRKPEQWYVTPNGLSAWFIGSRGCRVTLFETTKDGPIYRRIWTADERKVDRASLHTRDRKKAVRIARRLYATLMLGQEPTAPQAGTSGAAGKFGKVLLGQLIDLFVVESAQFLDNTEQSQRDIRGRLAVVRAYFGDTCDVRLLDRNKLYKYQAARRKGGIPYGDGKRTEPVRQRSVQADVKALKQVLNFAALYKLPDGSDLLLKNPLQGQGVAGEADVIRETATVERYDATRAAMRQFQQEYERRAAEYRRPDRKNGPKEGAAVREERNRDAWVRAELGLYLLEATGRRRGAVIGLRWDDVNFELHEITWRRDFDKKGKTWVVQYPQRVLDDLADFRERLDDDAGWLFPRQDDPSRPMPPEVLSQRVKQAEEAADLPKLAQTLTHAYRRKWRTERMHHPDKSCMEAGGWSDHATMIRCYDQPTAEDVLSVTSEPKKLHERTRPRRDVPDAA